MNKFFRCVVGGAAAVLVAAGSAWAIPDQVSVAVTNPVTGQAGVFDLERYNLRASNFHVRIYTDASNYYTLVELPEVCTFRGKVRGESNSFVTACFTPAGRMYARVSYAAVWWDNAADPVTGLRSWSISSLATTNAPASNGYVYAATTTMPLRVSATTSSYPVASSPAFGGPRLVETMQRQLPRLCRMAVDVVKDYFDGSCGSDIPTAIAMAEAKMNDADFVTARDDMIAYEITCVAIRPNVMDPYLSSGTARLGDCANFWSSQRATAPFDKVAAFTPIGGGVAYAPGDYSIEHADWYGGVIAHEVGHNWWAKDYEIQYFWDGSNTYHHAMNGSGLSYAPESVNRAQSIVRGKTDLAFIQYRSPLGPYATPDYAVATGATPVSVHVLANDHDVNSNALSVSWLETTSAHHGAVANLGGGVLRYTAPSNYVGSDYFHYKVTDGTGLESPARVTVLVLDAGDPLLAHWPLNETGGVTAVEATGRGVPARLNGADFSLDGVAGISGGALHLDGGADLYVGPVYDAAQASLSISLWAKPDDTPLSEQVLLAKHCSRGNSWNGYSLAMSGSSISFQGNVFGGHDSYQFSAYAALVPQPGTWYHLVAELDRTGSLARLWVNGVEHTATWNRRTIPAGEAVVSFHPLRIGAGDQGGAAKRFVGVLDDVRLYGKALSQAEVNSLYEGGGVLPASGPEPRDGEIDVALARALVWMPGRTNYQHDVYFGTDSNAVAAAATNAPEYKGRFAAAAYAPGTLATNTTYFWRVDEVAGTGQVVRSEIWQFTTAADALHGDLAWRLSLDARHTLGTTTYDLAGPPFEDGTLQGGPLAATGMIAEALSFDGTNDYVTAPALNLNTRAATISAWVRRSGAQSGWAGLVFCRGGNTTAGLNLGAANELRYHWNDDGATYNWNPGLTLPDGAWALAVLAVASNRAIMYLGATNGVLTARTNAITHAAEEFNGSLDVGRDSAGGRQFRGDIDDPMVWHRTLSAAEVQDLFTNGLAGLGIDGPPPVPGPGTFTWTGDADNQWTNPANWAALAAPGSNDTAVFDASSSRNLATDLGSDFALAGLDVRGAIRAVAITGTNGARLIPGPGGVKVTGTYAAVTLSAPAVVRSNQTWKIGAGASLDIDGTVTNAGRTLTWDADGTVTLNGTVSGSGALVKDGAGAAVVNSWNSHSGTTRVTRGTLTLARGSWYNGSDLGSSTLVVETGATVRTTATHVFDAGGNNPIRILGGTLTLGPESYIHSSFEILGGTFDGGGDARLRGGPIVRAHPKTSVIDVPVNLVNGGTYTFTVENGAADPDLLVSAPLFSSASLRKTGGGTMRLADNSTYSGSTAVDQGVLELAAVDNALPPATALTVSNGAEVRLLGVVQTLAGLSGGGTVSLGYGALAVNNTSRWTFAGVLTGAPGELSYAGDLEMPSGGLRKDGSGELVLTNANPYAGDTVIGAGALQLTGAGTLSASANVHIEGGATLAVTGRTAGAWTLGAAQSLGGFGTFLGRLAAAGTVAPGSDVARGAIAVSGTYTQLASGALAVRLSGPGQCDRLAVTGTAVLAGGLVVTNVGGYVPAIGDSFTVLTRASGSGAFASTNLPALPYGRSWLVGYAPTAVTLAVVSSLNLVTVRVDVADAAAAEQGSDPGTFTVTRAGYTNDPLTVFYALEGTASNGLDYATLSGAAMFAAGATAAVVTVTPVDDALTEGPETVVLSLLGGTNYTVGAPSTAVVTIADNDLPPAIALTRPATNQVFLPAGVGLVLEATVTDDGTPNPPGVTTSAWTVVNGPGAVTFGNAADASTTARFATNGTYTLRLTASDGQQQAATDLVVNVGVSQSAALTGLVVGTGSPAPTYSVTSGTWTLVSAGLRCVVSGNTGDDAELVAFPMTGDVEIKARVVSIQDVATSSSRAGVMIRENTAAGARSAFAGLTRNNPTPGGRFVYRATSNAANSSVSANSIGLPRWVRLVRAGNSFSAYQSASNGGWVQMGTTQTIGLGSSVWVGVVAGSGSATTPGTAVVDNVTITPAPTSTAANTAAWVDAGPGQGVVLPGSATLTGSASDDGKPAPPAAVTYAWSQIAGTNVAALASPTSLVTGVTLPWSGEYAFRLVADDGQVKTFDDTAVTATPTVVSVSAPDAAAAEAGPDPGSFLISRQGPTGSPLTVEFALGGSAAPGADYTNLDSSAVIPAGSTSITVSVWPIDDAEIEPPENVVLMLTATGGVYTLGASSTATVWIASDDRPVVDVVALDTNAAEFGLEPGLFALVRSGPTGGTVSVLLAASGIATAGVDYVALPTTVVLAVGQGVSNVVLQPLADTASEGAETVVWILQPDAGYSVGTSAAATVTIADVPVDDWRFQHFGSNANSGAAGDLADPDGDGYANLFEYGLGLDPRVADAVHNLAIAPTGLSANVAYWRAIDRPDITYRLVEAVEPGGPISNSAAVAVATNPAGAGRIEVRSLVPAAAPQKFIGLQITRP